MKQKIKDFLSFVGGVLIIFTVFSVIWFCSNGVERIYTIPVPETGLTVIHSETTLYGAEETTVIDYFYLMQGKDTIAWKCCPHNPYAYVRGIVFIPEKGLFDCRFSEIKQIMALDDKDSPMMTDVEGKNQVLIETGHPLLKWDMEWDRSEIKKYVYDLKTKKLSAK